MLGRYRRVARPTVFFAVRTVGWKVYEIGKVAGTGAFLQSVCDRIGAGEGAAFSDIAVLYKHGDGILRNLRFVCADDKKVTCAVIGERRNIFLDVFALTDVDIPLAEAVRIEHGDAFKVNAAVLVAVFRRL